MDNPPSTIHPPVFQLLDEDQVATLRQALTIISQKHGGLIPIAYYKDGMVAMVYSDINQAVLDIKKENGSYNVYTPVNRVKPDSLKLIGNNRSFRNDDIEIINDILIDIDAKRRNPDGSEITNEKGNYSGGKWSSTDAEHGIAIECAKAIKSYLVDNGIPVYSIEDSGNGAYLKIGLDVQASVATKDTIKNFLAHLADEFETSYDVEIDLSVTDLAQLVKVIGTYARKLEDEKAGRVQRLSKYLEPVNAEFPKANIRDITKLAKKHKDKVKNIQATADKKDRGIDTKRMLSDIGMTVYKVKQEDYGKVYVTDCPCNEEHKKKGKLTVLKSGAISFGCFHASCEMSDSTGNHWKEFKEHFGIDVSNYTEVKGDPKREAEIREAQEIEGKFHDCAMDVLISNDPLDFDVKAVSTIHVGDEIALLQLALAKAANTCLNTDGLHPNATGDSGDGKSHAQDSSLQTQPIEYKVGGDTSPKALLYMQLLPGTIVQMDDSTKFQEDKEKLFKRATTQFQEGASYDTLIDQKPAHLKIQSRTSFWITSVNGSFDMQVLNRCIAVKVDGSVKQDNSVRERQKQRNARAEPKMPVSDEILICREMWRILLKEPIAVVIPMELSDRYDKEVSRDNRRDFEFVSDFVKAAASVRRYQREKDDNGAVIATDEDVDTALNVWRSMKDNQETKLTEKQREVLAVMVAIQENKGEINSANLQRLCKLSKERVSQILKGEQGKAGLLSKVSELADDNISETSTEMKTHHRVVYELRYESALSFATKYRLVVPKLELDENNLLQIKKASEARGKDLPESTD